MRKEIREVEVAKGTREIVRASSLLSETVVEEDEEEEVEVEEEEEVVVVEEEEKEVMEEEKVMDNVGSEESDFLALPSNDKGMRRSSFMKRVDAMKRG